MNEIILLFSFLLFLLLFLFLVIHSHLSSYSLNLYHRKRNRFTCYYSKIVSELVRI